ncbi:hypothetical protein [Novosphingobium aquimarinum]|uniref:hypothetical protein n=1 Tax=Novosphingobium aquimarinum TaxID=2682494 RepID=UPI0012EB7E7F|nr:hypothetical protein [Novosphingobium aquimarinum]
MTDFDPPNTAPARLPNGQFGPGNPGRPKGSRNRLNAQLLDKLGDLTSQSILVLRERLNANDLKAAMYILDRFLPTSRSIEINSTEPNAWADAMAAGDLTVAEGHKAASALKLIADSQEVRDLRARLDDLEQVIAAAKGR